MQSPLSPRSTTDVIAGDRLIGRAQMRDRKGEDVLAYKNTRNSCYTFSLQHATGLPVRMDTCDQN